MTLVGIEIDTRCFCLKKPAYFDEKVGMNG